LLFSLPNFRRRLLQCVACCVGLLNMLFGRRKRVVLCCPPVPEGNRGDQALLRAVVESLKSAGYEHIHLVQTSYHPIESIKPDATISIHKQFGPVFESPLCFKEQFRFALFMLCKRDVILVGCDVLDEGYSKSRSEGSLFAMALASHAVRSTRIIGFSVNDTSSPSLYTHFRHLRERGVRLFARDALTFERLRTGGVEGAELVGDLAFLLEPAPLDDLQDRELHRFISEHRGRLVGLNFTQVVMGKGEDKDRLFRNMVEVCGRLSREMNIRFLCIPHDDQGGIEYLEELHRKIDAGYPGVSYLVKPMPPASHLKRIAGECLHVFTCRLHLGIATLGMGRAVMGFPYQGKFEGQFRHFGLDESGLIPKKSLPVATDDLVEVFRSRIEASEIIAKQVQTKLPDVLTMSRKNFEGL